MSLLPRCAITPTSGGAALLHARYLNLNGNAFDGPLPEYFGTFIGLQYVVLCCGCRAFVHTLLLTLTESSPDPALRRCCADTWTCRATRSLAAFLRRGPRSPA